MLGIDTLTKPVMGFRPAGIPLGPAAIGLLGAGVAAGATNALLQRFLPKQKITEQTKRVVGGVVLAGQAWALLKFKPLHKLLGDAAVPAALLLSAALPASSWAAAAFAFKADGMSTRSNVCPWSSVCH